MAASDFDQVVEQQHTALDAFARGDDKPLAALWSQADDVTLGNPFGPFVSGFRQVAATMEAAAAYYREGEASGFDLIAKHVGDDVAYWSRWNASGPRWEGMPMSLLCLFVARASSVGKMATGGSCIVTPTR